MDNGLWLLLLVIVAAVVFDYINGFHDTANAIATVVSTRVLSPLAAVLLAAFFNFVGAFTGTNVAKTIGADIVGSAGNNQIVVLCALFGAITWNLLTWYWGLPSSSSHALIGSLIGSALAANSFNLGVIKGEGVTKVIIGLVTSPIFGFIGGYFVMVALTWILVKSTPHFVNRWFKRLQLFSASFMAFSHGGNDAQKTMGIITLALLTYEGKTNSSSFSVPVWVIALSATAMALGTATGGWRIIRTMGSKIIDLQPVQGFAAETSAATVIEVASRLGLPVSTTHVISSSIMGVGSSRNPSAVRWTTVGNIVRAWVLTIPACIILGAVFYLLINLIFPI
jgi:PiT family inorganic phosphate transporter